MGLQRFKLQVANTVISQENTNLQTMGTEQLLALFQYEHKQPTPKPADDDENPPQSAKEEDTSSATASSSGTGYNSLLEEWLPKWENQYENEYDLSEFIKSLKN